MQLPETITIQTSGSEGQPKTVILTAETLLASARIGQLVEDLRVGDCWLNCLSPSYIAGQAIQYRCAAASATMRSHPGFDPRLIELEIERGSVTHISLVPVMLSRLLQQYGERSPHRALRTVLVGGDRLPKSLALRAVTQGWPLVVSYGMTETASRIAMLRLTPESIGAWEEHDVGPPLPGVEITTDVDGAIRISSEVLFPGEGREIVTRDHGAIDERGHLHLYGRMDHQILSGGVLIDPLSVEQQLNQCPWVGAVGVTGSEDAEWGEIVVAVVEEPLSVEAREWIQRQLPAAVRPRRFKVVEQLRYSVHGKLDRQWLQQVGQDVA